MGLTMPIQTLVDRAAVLDMYLLSETIEDKKTGKTVLVIKWDFNDPAGPLAGDPGQFSATVDPRVRGCEMFRGRGCLSGSRYF